MSRVGELGAAFQHARRAVSAQMPVLLGRRLIRCNAVCACKQAAILTEGVGMAVTREEASPLAAEADELYRDALRQVANELGLEHPRALALKVGPALDRGSCAPRDAHLFCCTRRT